MKLIGNREAPAAAVSAAFEPHRLVQAMQLTGMSRRELAEAMGVPVAEIQRWEFSIREPRPDQRLKLADVLGQVPGFFDRGRPMPLLDSMDVHICGVRSRSTHPGT